MNRVNPASHSAAIVMAIAAAIGPALAQPAPAPEKPSAEKEIAAAALTAAAIAALIIKESRNQYYATGHPCACPDDHMRNGNSCGNVSAYVRPGGAHPLCFARDVTEGMIADYRTRAAR